MCVCVQTYTENFCFVQNRKEPNHNYCQVAMGDSAEIQIYENMTVTQQMLHDQVSLHTFLCFHITKFDNCIYHLRGGTLPTITSKNITAMCHQLLQFCKVDLTDATKNVAIPNMTWKNVLYQIYKLYIKNFNHK